MSKRTPTAFLTMKPLVSIDNLAALLKTSRRTVERLRADGNRPAPDLRVGEMARWRPETLRAWISGQYATSN